VVGGPVTVRMTLRNEGALDVRVLPWNTPLEEAWFGTPFVVTREGQELTYAGAMVKRAEPAAEDYVLAPAGGSVSALADLAQVYPLDQAGAYEVRTDGWLADVVMGDEASPRPRDGHRGLALDCPPLRFTLGGG
jgi:hypothetical protein